MSEEEEKRIVERLAAYVMPRVRKQLLDEFKDLVRLEVLRNLYRFLNLSLNVEQLAELCDVKKQAIYKRMERKQISFRKMGRQMVISLKELKTLVSETYVKEVLKFLENR